MRAPPDLSEACLPQPTGGARSGPSRRDLQHDLSAGCPGQRPHGSIDPEWQIVVTRDHQRRPPLESAIRSIGAHRRTKEGKPRTLRGLR
eukprot:5546723-Prymnesium_polylepis.1